MQVNRMPVDCFDKLDKGRSSRSYRAVRTAVSGYAVTSTAPCNTDEKVKTSDSVDCSVAQAEQGVRAIAQDLHRIKNDPTLRDAPQLVIAVHGYNTAESNIREWYHDIFRYAAQDDKYIRQHRNLVFVGYRWSSERILFTPAHLWANIGALPSVPKALLAMAPLLLGLSFFTLLADAWRSLRPMAYTASPLTDGLNRIFDPQSVSGLAGTVVFALFKILLGSAMMIATAMAVLLLLRLLGYFRDVYRAINFAVPDLTELIRQIDQAVIDLEVQAINQSHTAPLDALRKAKQKHTEPSKRINLTFLGHSMGGLVITNVVRIISDVFDRRSIAMNPTAEIGHTLRLGRLILASPDIPVLSVVSNRANGLASSLRRFDEAYLFSNEGDLALRLASTTANYISFPSAHQHHGHRLGSIALRNDIYRKGIINLPILRQKYSTAKTLYEAINEDDYDILKCLFITHSSDKKDKYRCLSNLFKDEHNSSSPASLADLFTFFDCTDYKDWALQLKGSAMNSRSKDERGLLTRAKNKPHLTLIDYMELMWDMATGQRDVHGGYFHGEYSRELIYQIAFLGFEGMLQAVAAEEQSVEMGNPNDVAVGAVETAQMALDAFHQRCEAKGLQVYLSPLRYRVNVQGAPLAIAREEMLETVKTTPKPSPHPYPKAEKPLAA